MRGLSALSSVVLTAVPWLKEGHVVARLNFDGPRVTFFLWMTKDETEGCTKHL